jgi:hypothetical protein
MRGQYEVRASRVQGEVEELPKRVRWKARAGQFVGEGRARRGRGEGETRAMRGEARQGECRPGQATHAN